MHTLMAVITNLIIVALATGYNKQAPSNFLEVGTLILSIIGALAWTPFLIDETRKSQIYGKVINYWTGFNAKTQSDRFGIIRTAKGLQYIIKLSTVVANKSFYLKDCDVYIKYKNDKAIYQGVIFWPDNFTYTDDNEKRHNLRIKPDENIKFLHVFQKDITTNFYAIFIVENVKDENVNNFEYIEFRFYNHKRQELKLTINSNDIDSLNLLGINDMFD